MITLFTLKGPLPSVSPEMIRQMPMCRKWPSTVFKRALEWFLSIVDAYMCLEVAFLCETLATSLELADKRLFSHLDNIEWLVRLANKFMRKYEIFGERGRERGIGLHEYACGFSDGRYVSSFCRRCHMWRAYHQCGSTRGFSNDL